MGLIDIPASKESVNEEDKWIQQAIKKPGALHTQLKVPQGEKIPLETLKAAAEKGGKLGRRARLALTLRKLKELYNMSEEDAGKLDSLEDELDPVGQEDADVDNDGDVDSSDKYLKNRRDVVASKIKAPVNEESNEEVDNLSSSEDDHEGSMAKADLLAIHKKAGEIYNMLGDNEQLEGWVQSKITLAEDYISTVANYMMSEVDEEVMQEGRPSQRHPLEGHDYHKKTDAELIYIAKDAHKAAEAMKSHNTEAENKYRDQANDSATVRHFRKTSGMPEWYKKKYGHIKEDIDLEEGAFSSGALTPSQKMKDLVSKIPSKSIVVNKDEKGVYTSTKVDGKEVSRKYKTDEQVELDEVADDIHSHRVGDEVVLKNKDYHGVIIKSKGSDISFKNKSDGKHYKATHGMIDRNISQENRYKEKSDARNKKIDDAMASDMKRIDKSGALKKFGIGVKEQVEQIDEISKTTLGSYVKRASQDAVTKAMKYASKRDESGKESGTLKKISDRESGIRKATDRLTKEEVESLDELSKDTLKSYMDKSSKDNLTSLMKPGMIAKKHAAKRFIGMVKAGEKLAKESNSANMPADIGTPAQLSLKPNPKKLETPVYEAKSDIPFEGPYSKAKDTVTDKSGAKHGPMSRVRSLARQAIQKQKVTQKKTVNESRRMEIVREAMVDAKKKDAVKKVEKKVSTGGKDKFQQDPELSSNITKNA
jgi:hypothetical protein